MPYRYASKREHERGNTNDAHRRHNVHLQKRKRDANSQRIDACCNGQQEQFLQVKIETVARFFFAAFCVMEHIPKHLPADKSQKRKSNPVGYRGHKAGKLRAQRPTQSGHERLKHPEKQRNYRSLLHIQTRHS